MEDILKKIENLKEDLSTKHVLENTQKKKSVGNELQQIFNSSGWYSARYIAGKALGIDNEYLDKQVGLWVNELEKELGATKKEERHIGHWEKELVYFPVKRYYDEEDSELKEVWVEESKIFCFVDEVKRQKAIEDAGELFRHTRSHLVELLLKRVYDGNDYEILYWGQNFNAVEEIDGSGEGVEVSIIARLRREAGRQLGYNEFRIWVHVHPMAAILAGIVIGSVIFILVFI
ncbi:MAG: hypothetical protein AYK18_01595 [Theionarchaea archaeon DG-70]|nr:MAG: hypothetical protein AYK18_01595 [Theionarchaea archaeon DG-70]